MLMLSLLFKMMRVWLQMQHIPTSSLQDDSIGRTDSVKSHVSQTFIMTYFRIMLVIYMGFF